MLFANLSPVNNKQEGLAIGDGVLTFTNPFISGNSASASGSYDGIDIKGGSRLTFVGGQSSASAATGVGAATQNYGINVENTFSGYLNVKGMELTKNVSGQINNASSSARLSIFGNTGIDDNTTQSVADAATIALPLNPVVKITGSGTAISTINGGWYGRTVNLVTTAVAGISFTTGGNIVNACTSVQNGNCSPRRLQGLIFEG